MDPRAAALAADLQDARARTLALVGDLTDEQLRVPRLSIVNPPVWEIGHVAWFQERWTLRRLDRSAPVRADGDALYDSAEVHHDVRWEIALPGREETLRFLEVVLERVIAGLASRPFTDEAEYFHRLVLSHEDMHGEALVYTRQT